MIGPDPCAACGGPHDIFQGKYFRAYDSGSQVPEDIYASPVCLTCYLALGPTSTLECTIRTRKVMLFSLAPGTTAPVVHSPPVEFADLQISFTAAPERPEWEVWRDCTGVEATDEEWDPDDV